MRHRLEDLGRIAAMLHNVLNHDLFNEDNRPRRPKDVWEWFKSKAEDQQDDILRQWAYGLEDLSEQLYEMLSIAEGTDTLNENNAVV